MDVKLYRAGLLDVFKALVADDTRLKLNSNYWDSSYTWKMDENISAWDASQYRDGKLLARRAALLSTSNGCLGMDLRLISENAALNGVLKRSAAAYRVTVQPLLLLFSPSAAQVWSGNRKFFIFPSRRGFTRLIIMRALKTLRFIQKPVFHHSFDDGFEELWATLSCFGT